MKLKKMQRNSNTSVLPEWEESHGGGGAKGGSSENAVWNKNTEHKTFSAIIHADLS